MACKFCDQNSKLIKSHIIPEAFFRRLRDESLPPKLFSEDQHPKRVPIGIYDEKILCQKCDSYFGTFDNYAQKILTPNLEKFVKIIDGERVTAHILTTFNYKLLKLFFISILWRASISESTFYRRIKLGPLESQAKNMLQLSNPGTVDEFGVILCHFDHELSRFILDPHTDRFSGGIWYNRFYLGNFVAHIKTDSRPAPSLLSDYQINPQQPLIIIARDLQKSKELPILQKLITKTQKRKNTLGNPQTKTNL